MDDFLELYTEKLEKPEKRKKKEIVQNNYEINGNTNISNTNFISSNVENPNIGPDQSTQSFQNTFNKEDLTTNGPLYDYDYKIILLNKFEEGLMDNYLSGIIYIYNRKQYQF